MTDSLNSPWQRESEFEWGALSAEDREIAAEAGFAAFDAAEILAILTDRSASQWAQETPADVIRARDILRAALVSVVALIGGERSTVAARMARAIETSPEGRALRDALRRGEQVAERDLLTLYARITREAV
jgi:hypothetical protein